MKQHYEKLNLPKKIVQEFNKARDFLNKTLDSESNFKPFGKPKYTCREIFESHIFGNFAHSTKQKEFEQLNKSEFIGTFSNYFFLELLYIFYQILTQIKKINKKALNHLTAS